MKRINVYFIFLMFMQACSHPSEQRIENPTIKIENETVKHGKPSNKDILLMVMQNCDVLLSADSSCLGVGSEFNDSTIGQFLSSFWQYHADSIGANSLTINVTEGNDKEVKEKFWKAAFMINGQTENENWSWGVSFYIMDNNWLVDKKSFKCLGAG